MCINIYVYVWDVYIGGWGVLPTGKLFRFRLSPPNPILILILS